MNKGSNSNSGRNLPRRSVCRISAIAALFVLTAATLGGCPDADSDAAKAFRDAASSTVEAGIKQVADGFISGVFALVEPEDATSTDSGTATGGTGG